MEIKGTEIEINGIKYVPKGSESQTVAVNTEGLEYHIIRGGGSGVFAGYLEKREGREVTLRSCRRLWSWVGAATCSQLAIDGVLMPDECHFPEALNRIIILDAVEIIPATGKARASIESVKPWKA